MTRRKMFLSAAAVLVLGIVGGTYCFYQQVLPNFRVVRSGVLWRSGQPNACGLRIARLAGIKTIVCLRDARDEDVAAERDFARRQGIEFISSQLHFSGAGVAAVVANFAAIVADPRRQPVLVHCARGKERSGVCAAVFRMEFEGWSNEQALREMYELGFKQGSLPALESFVTSYLPHAGVPGPALAAGGTPREAATGTP